MKKKLPIDLFHKYIAIGGPNPASALFANQLRAKLLAVKVPRPLPLPLPLPAATHGQVSGC